MTIIDRRYSVAEGQAIKTPCKVATTANITLSGAQTIDGVAVTETTPPTRVLVKDQSNQVLNGIYDVSTGNWTRARDFDGAFDIVDGTLINVTDGTASADTVFTVSASSSIVVGTSNIVIVAYFSQVMSAAAVTAAAAAAASAAAAAAAARLTFETYAAAAAANIPVSENFIRTAGYYAVGDGGGGLYKRISTPSPVKAWHLHTNDGAYWLLAPVELTPQMVGAKGDGTNDPTGVQAFFDALKAGIGTFGQLVYGSNYRSDTQINFDNAAEVEIRGCGKGARLQFNAAIGLNINDTYVSGQDIVFSNVWIYTTSTTNNIILIKHNNSGTKFLGCYVEGGQDQIKCGESTFGVHFHLNTFYNCTGRCIYLIPTTAFFCNYITIDKNEFFGCKRAIEGQAIASIRVLNNRFERIAAYSGALSFTHFGSFSNDITYEGNYNEDSQGGIPCLSLTDINGVSIRKNIFAPNQDGGNVGPGCTTVSIQFIDVVSSFVIADNSFNYPASTANVIDMASAAVQGRISDNRFNSIVSTVAKGIAATAFDERVVVERNTWNGTWTVKSDIGEQQECWAYFNGVSASILKARGISNLVYNSVGNYTLTIDRAMASANFMAVAGGACPSNGTLVCVPRVTAQSMTSVTIQVGPTGNGTGGNADSASIGLHVIGELA